MAVTQESSRHRPLRRSQVRIISPLRYPGAKRRLSAFIAATLTLNRLRPRLFVEPFAGSASVALELLERDMVDEVALGELDPLVAAFWRVVFTDTTWLLDQVSKIDVSVDTWNRLKHSPRRSLRAKALACLYLNRTSFSGILNSRAGPIGGQHQDSKYEIGCRFSRTMLAKRLGQVAKLRARVRFVHKGDWKTTISKAESFGLPKDDIFFYCDPPFYRKAERLYNFWFDDTEHLSLRDSLSKLTSPWLLSYDPAQEVVDMYRDPCLGRIRISRVELLYTTAAKTNPLGTCELVITNLDKLPQARRLWRSMSEWKVRRGGSRSGSTSAARREEAMRTPVHEVVDDWQGTAR